ncbi:DNA helicase, partial [Salmonella enterica subsp. enterica serovar Enteritidis]
TYAVASTLENIANRLADEVAAGKLRDNRGGLFLADFETGDELEEEIVEEAEETTAPASSAQLDEETLKRMRAEVEELREYAALARSITDN